MSNETKEEFKERLSKFHESLGNAQETIDFTQDETDIIEELSFYVNKVVTLIGTKMS